MTPREPFHTVRPGDCIDSVIVLDDDNERTQVTGPAGWRGRKPVLVSVGDEMVDCDDVRRETHTRNSDLNAGERP
jgi:hypothetical protein